MNQYRKYFSTGVGFTFVIVGSTGVMLQFFFKNHSVEHIHGWLGVAMVVLAIVHIVQNWPPLRNYFRDWRVFTLLVPVVLVMALFLSGPDGQGQGVNPRQVAGMLCKANVQDAAKALGKDAQTVLAAMTSDGLNVAGPDESIQQLAQRNHKSPEGLLGYFLK